MIFGFGHTLCNEGDDPDERMEDRGDYKEGLAGTYDPGIDGGHRHIISEIVAKAAGMQIPRGSVSLHGVKAERRSDSNARR